MFLFSQGKLGSIALKQLASLSGQVHILLQVNEKIICTGELTDLPTIGLLRKLEGADNVLYTTELYSLLCSGRKNTQVIRERFHRSLSREDNTIANFMPCDLTSCRICLGQPRDIKSTFWYIRGHTRIYQQHAKKVELRTHKLIFCFHL